MPNNPMPLTEAPTRTATTVRAVKQFTNRHAEVVTYAAGVLTGSVLFAIAGLL